MVRAFCKLRIVSNLGADKARRFSAMALIRAFVMAGGFGLLTVMTGITPSVSAIRPDRTENPAVGTIALTGALPDDHSGSANVFVFGLPDLSGVRTGQRFALPVLAGGTFGQGAAFRLLVSASYARSGNVINTQIVGISKAGMSVVFVPVAIRPGAGSVVSIGRLPSFSASLLRTTAAAEHMAASHFMSLRHPRCNGTIVGRKITATRIGELHVAAGSKVHGAFTYAVKADSQITVGELVHSRWITAGSTLIDNAGPGGSVPVKKATDRYVEANFTFDLVHFTGGCSYYAQMAVKWDGGAPALGGKAPLSPQRSCHADPSGFVTLKPGLTAIVSGYQAVDYRTGGAVGFRGYSFGALSGYSKNVHPSWTNADSVNTFLCGSGRDKRHHRWPIIYNQSR